MCDVFGSSANTLNIGNHKRDFNHFSRRFSNAPVVERIFIMVQPNMEACKAYPIQTFSKLKQGGTKVMWFEIDISQIDSKGDINWSA